MQLKTHTHTHSNTRTDPSETKTGQCMTDKSPSVLVHLQTEEGKFWVLFVGGYILKCWSKTRDSFQVPKKNILLIGRLAGRNVSGLVSTKEAGGMTGRRQECHYIAEVVVLPRLYNIVSELRYCSCGYHTNLNYQHSLLATLGGRNPTPRS